MAYNLPLIEPGIESGIPSLVDNYATSQKKTPLLILLANPCLF